LAVNVTQMGANAQSSAHLRQGQLRGALTGLTAIAVRDLDGQSPREPAWRPPVEIPRTCAHGQLVTPVAAEHRRQQIGSRLVHKLVGKLSGQRRTRVILEVRETNLAAQLFFRQQGFRAVSVLRDFYDDSTEDAYLMQYRNRPTESPVALPGNRITRLAG
jgi:GNAT superfamily N-acetyltransferase